MPLTIAEAVNKAKIFNEIVKEYPRLATDRKWTEKDFKFTKPGDGWLLSLKHHSKLNVTMHAYNSTFVVSLNGESDKAGKVTAAVGNIGST